MPRLSLKLISGQPRIAYAVWIALLGAALLSLFERDWRLAFLSVSALVLSLLPALFARRFGIRLPMSFSVAILVFVVGSIFLGEAFDFYERYWWWDVVLHGGSAVGFGLIGFVFVFMLFEGDRYAAPAWAVSFFALCFAVFIGTAWEIFEFAMDSAFGMSMQKSGLVDTMWDLITDVIGALVGASAGFAYLRYRARFGLAGQIADFIEKNRRFFRKFDDHQK